MKIKWIKEGSFLDQIKEVWKCYVDDNEYPSAIISVTTINYCIVKSNGVPTKSFYGIESAKVFVESQLKNINP